MVYYYNVMKDIIKVIWSKEFLLKILIVVVIGLLIKIFILLDDVIGILQGLYPFVDGLEKFIPKI